MTGLDSMFAVDPCLCSASTKKLHYFTLASIVFYKEPQLFVNNHQINVVTFISAISLDCHVSIQSTNESHI